VSKEMGTTHRQTAIDEYGQEAVAQSEQALLALGKEGIAQLKARQKQVNQELFALKEEDPQSESVQQLIQKHYDIIRAFWGTTKETDKQAEAYAGLGELYVSDESYLAINRKPQPEFAQFMKQAMAHFAESKLQ
jgi:transposase